MLTLSEPFNTEECFYQQEVELHQLVSVTEQLSKEQTRLRLQQVSRFSVTSLVRSDDGLGLAFLRTLPVYRPFLTLKRPNM